MGKLKNVYHCEEGEMVKKKKKETKGIEFVCGLCSCYSSMGLPGVFVKSVFLGSCWERLQHGNAAGIPPPRLPIGTKLKEKMLRYIYTQDCLRLSFSSVSRLSRASSHAFHVHQTYLFKGF